MRKLLQTALVVLLTSLSVNTMAQQPNGDGRKHEIPSPEKIAKQITDEMNTTVQLNDKQYKKVYKLLLKDQRAQQKKQSSSSDNSNRPPMGGPGGDMGEGMPPMGGDMPPMMGEDSSSASSPQEIAEAKKKAEEKKDNKLKKILTAEQFSKWKAVCAKHMEDAPGNGHRAKRG